MTNPKYDSKEPIRIEDLLRVKKAERPDSAFWDRFDGELHQRMLQTLVRKEPWYVQLGRAVSGRIAQSTAVASAAALLALLVVRPALVTVEPANSAKAASAVVVEADAPVTDETAGPREIRMADLNASDPNTRVAEADYRTDVISASSDDGEVTYRRDFEMDTVQVASSEAADYSGDSAGNWATFSNTGVASLVY